MEAFAEKLWNADYWKAMVGNFLLFFSFYILSPLLPIYLDAQFHADKDMIGLVLSGYVIAALAIRPFGGFIVDTFDRKKVLLILYFAFFILFTGYIGAGTLLMFAIVRTLHGIPFSTVTVANATAAIDTLPDSRRDEGIGYYGMSNNLAMAVAPSIGIWIYNATGNFSLLFWIALATSLTGMLTVSTLNLPKREMPKEKRPVTFSRFFLTRGWLLALNIAVLSISWGIVSNFVALYGAEKLLLEDGTGLFFMILSAGLLLSRIQGGKALAKGRLMHNAALGILLSLAGYLLFAAAPAPWAYYLTAAFIGLGNGLFFPAFMNMFIHVAHAHERGNANSSLQTAWDVGSGLGLIAGGFLLQYMSYNFAFWAAALIFAAGGAIFFLFTRSFYLRRKLP